MLATSLPPGFILKQEFDDWWRIYRDSGEFVIGGNDPEYLVKLVRKLYEEQPCAS